MTRRSVWSHLTALSCTIGLRRFLLAPVGVERTRVAPSKIDPNSFPYLVADFHRRGATGSLYVHGWYDKALYFRHGHLLFASSNDPEDSLGTILIEQRKLSRDQLDRANSRLGPGNPLANELAESGYVSQRDLEAAARFKIERILAGILVTETGTFEFEDQVLPKDAIDLKQSTERVFLSAVKRSADRAYVRRHLGSLELVLAATEGVGHQLEELRHETGELPRHLDGRRTLKEAAALSHLGDLEAGGIACGLLFLGLLHPVQPTPRS